MASTVCTHSLSLVCLVRRFFLLVSLVSSPLFQSRALCARLSRCHCSTRNSKLSSNPPVLNSLAHKVTVHCSSSHKCSNQFTLIEQQQWQHDLPSACLLRALNQLMAIGRIPLCCVLLCCVVLEARAFHTCCRCCCLCGEFISRRISAMSCSRNFNRNGGEAVAVTVAGAAGGAPTCE